MQDYRRQASTLRGRAYRRFPRLHRGFRSHRSRGDTAERAIRVRRGDRRQRGPARRRPDDGLCQRRVRQARTAALPVTDQLESDVNPGAASPAVSRPAAKSTFTITSRRSRYGQPDASPAARSRAGSIPAIFARRWPTRNRVTGPPSARRARLGQVLLPVGAATTAASASGWFSAPDSPSQHHTCDKTSGPTRGQPPRNARCTTGTDRRSCVPRRYGAVITDCDCIRRKLKGLPAEYSRPIGRRISLAGNADRSFLPAGSEEVALGGGVGRSLEAGPVVADLCEYPATVAKLVMVRHLAGRSAAGVGLCPRRSHEHASVLSAPQCRRLALGKASAGQGDRSRR